MKECDYLIVGAGLYGATLAHELHEAGYKVIVIDKRGHVAGNIYSESQEDIEVHVYGAHIFHTSNDRVNNYVRKFATFNNFVNQPLGLYKGVYYHLPFNMYTFEKLFGVKTPEEAKARIEKEREEAGIKEPKNLEEQAISLVGKTVYETLIKGYTEKQWGKDAKDLPPSIIKRVPVRFEYNNNYFNDIYQGIPIGGYTKMVENMLDGIEVILNMDYDEHRDEFNAKKVIYTGPIDKYYDYCYGHLEYRSLRFETELLKQKDFQGNAVVNYNEREVPFTRIIEHKYFEFKDQPYTIITREYPATWKEGDEPFYPLNDEKNNELYQKYFELSKKDDHVIFGGRLGLYRYIDMDDVIELALNKADELLKRSS